VLGVIWIAVLSGLTPVRRPRPGLPLCVYARQRLALLLSRSVYQARLGCPPRIRLGSQKLHLFLPRDILPLLQQRRRRPSHVSEPLMPLWRHSHVGAVDLIRVLHYPPPSPRPVTPEVAELPEGVALKVQACPESVRELIVKAPGHVPTRYRFRHGRRNVFHLYHALKNGEICVGAIGSVCLGCGGLLREIVKMGG